MPRSGRAQRTWLARVPLLVVLGMDVDGKSCRARWTFLPHAPPGRGRAGIVRLPNGSGLSYDAAGEYPPTSRIEYRIDD
jgi:hypothetical protein